MKHDINQVIRRHRNGSIDSAYYVRRGRVARSRAVYAAARGATAVVRGAILRLATKAGVFPAARRTSVS